ncbi:Gfo/Idh/MocA family protein [Paenibacillus segetis]|uniref:Dehydrogenase n=1 Tax=Paenibacillus segetis TaxID=1325360 RepID=A0ABQ1Y4K1_9BACL|nr:Gfo/Idh/MocA family oxidoreductase [Paenibacillus segetis]GGH12047.1 dehydrogenase [Paenibacillus segetis]
MNQSTARKVKWGIMSTGWIAEQFAQDLVHVNNGIAYAVGSRSQESADRFAAKFNIPHAYANYENLVNDPEVEALYVGTPHPFHCENVLLALRAGKAVLCEKPFTVNSDELSELITTARQSKLFLMEAMWTRFLTPIVQVRKWLKEGRIGTVKLLKADAGFRADWNPQGRLLNPDLGGGALLDIGIYPVSFASMIFGPHPEKIQSNVHIGETGVDEQFSLLLDYGEGRTATLNGAIRLQLRNDAYIYGTEGMIHVPSFLEAKSATLFVDGKEVEKYTDEREAIGYAFEAEEVGRCLLTGVTESSVISLDESLNIMKLLDEVRRQWGLRYPFE